MAAVFGGLKNEHRLFTFGFSVAAVVAAVAWWRQTSVENLLLSEYYTKTFIISIKFFSGFLISSFFPPNLICWNFS